MKKINIISIFINFLFILIYCFPIYYFTQKTGYEIDKYIFLIFSIFTYGVYVLQQKKIEVKEAFFILLILLVVYFKKSLEPLLLIEYLLLYKILRDKKNSINIPNSILVISTIGVLFYSILYFGNLKGYLCTGLMEINQSGFLIFFLFTIIYHRNKKIGTLLLLFGLLTLSRNYLLCLIVLFFMNNKISYKLSEKLNFKALLAISLVFLTILSYSFNYAYDNNKISESYSDYRKFIYIYDYSNYFRFSTNFNLIELYFQHPTKLLTGIDDEEFIALAHQLAINKSRLYRPILPHNYFFSYFRIYGIFCIFIFMFLEKIVTLVTNKKSFIILLILFIYGNILGVGFTNYYLFLTMFTMLEFYGGKNEKEDNNSY